MKTIAQVREAIEAKKCRSAWDRGVGEYALELLEALEELREYEEAGDEINPHTVETELLNGAENWEEYSWGGCALICDEDIARRLCNPSELKRTDGRSKAPNSREHWLDVQARALRQAQVVVRACAIDVKR